MGTTPSRMTDTLYFTVDTSRIGEEDKSKAGRVKRCPEVYLFVLGGARSPLST
jgi:hypothetical protein